MAYLAGVGTALGRYEYAQETITRAFADLVLGEGASRSQHDLVERIHAATGVRIAILLLPLEQYTELSGFGAANDVFLDVGVDIAEHAAVAALTDAGLRSSGCRLRHDGDGDWRCRTKCGRAIEYRHLGFVRTSRGSRSSGLVVWLAQVASRAWPSI